MRLHLLIPLLAAATSVAQDAANQIPAGTWITVRVDQPLSTKQNRAGDSFALTLAQPVVAQGVVLARRGQMLVGAVTDAARAGRVNGKSHLAVAIREMTLADGRSVAVKTELADFSAGGSKGRDTATVGAMTAAGAAIGAGAAGGVGAGIGAAAGAGASAVAVLLGRGRDTQIPAESILAEPVTVDLERNRWAFQPVQQADFETRPLQARVQPQPSMLYYDPWFWGPGWGWGSMWGPGWGWGGPRVFVGGAGRGFGGGRGRGR